MSRDLELLVGLSYDELEALADSVLAPSAQHRLDDLLERVDQLTILKTRARYTLRQQAGAIRA
jgi:hypothetical protein